MTIHKPVAIAILSALEQIFGEGYHADKVLERLFKANRQFGSRDRRFIAETTYDITRWWRFIWASLAVQPGVEKEELWALLGGYLTLLSKQPLPQWPEFKGIDIDKIKARAKYVSKNPADRESVPDWLFDLGKEQIGEKWEAYLAALNKQAPVVLRANRLRIDRDGLKRALATEEIETVVAPGIPDGLILKVRQNIFTAEAFKKGLFEVQDGASQQVAPMLDPKPGERIIDACAGAGGKSLHIAALMKNKGKVLSLDIHDRKLEELRKRSSRAGADIIETRAIESSKTIKRLENTADRLLLDVPCTGLGVLRRIPDKKWSLNPEEVAEVSKLQAHLLDTYSKMLKPGGRLVYATCSILPSENENQVAQFMEKHPGEYEMIEERKFPPGENDYDGFYAASFQKKI